MQRLKAKSDIKENGSKFLYRSPFRVALFFLLLGAMFFFYLGVGYHTQYTSDAAVALPEARSILQGNVLLKGWTLSTVSYYTTDIPFFVIGLSLFGFSSNLVYLITAFSYSLLVTIIVYMSATNENGTFSYRKAFTAVVFSFFLALLFHQWALFQPIHLSAYLYGLGCLMCIRKMQRDAHWLHFILYAILLTLSSIGDTFSIYLLGFPVMLVCLIRLSGKEPKQKYVILLITTALSIIASMGFLKWIELAGGFVLPKFAPGFVSLPNLGRNLILTIAGLLDLFGANPFGMSLLSPQAVISIIRMAGVTIFILALAKVVITFRNQSLMFQVIAAIIVINFLEYAIGNAAVNRSTVRYLVPSLLFGIILICKDIYENAELSKHLKATILLLTFLGVSSLPPIAFSRSAFPVDRLGTFLINHQLSNGYGPFWCAPITTVATDGKVTVHSVISIQNGEIGPFQWLSEKNEYKGYANFLVIDADENNDGFSITMQTAINTFGNPDHVYLVDNRFTVLTWDHDISPFLSAGGAFGVAR